MDADPEVTRNPIDRRLIMGVVVAALLVLGYFYWQHAGETEAGLIFFLLRGPPLVKEETEQKQCGHHDANDQAPVDRLAGQVRANVHVSPSDLTIPRRSRSIKCAHTDPPAAGIRRGSSPG